MAIPRECWRTGRGAALAILAAVALLPPSRGADDPPAGSPVPSDPVFQALRTDGSTVSGRIRQLGAGNEVVLEGASGPVTVPFDRLVKLTREGDLPASPPEGSLVLFPEGDRLQAVIGVSNEKTLEVLPPILGDAPIAVTIDAPLALILAPPADSQAQEDLIARVRDEPRESEVLWLANGDRLTGGFLGLTAQKVLLQRDGAETSVDRSGVVAIEFDPAIVAYPEPGRPFLELTFLDGSRLGVSDCRIEQGQIVAQTRFGAAIRPPLAKLARVHVRGDHVRYLADRKESRAVFVGYLGEGTHREKFGRNTTLDGRVLRVGGAPHDRGLGTQSRTLLAYRLEPGDRRFQATVALDDRAGPLGSVVFRVLLDGKEKFATPSMTVRDAPREIDLDLSGAKILILAAEFGDRGDVQDQADWIEARLIR